MTKQELIKELRSILADEIWTELEKIADPKITDKDPIVMEVFFKIKEIQQKADYLKTL